VEFVHYVFGGLLERSDRIIQNTLRGTMTKDDLTVVYYTSNFLEKTNPFFLKNTKDALVKAIGELPLLVVSSEPVNKRTFEGYEGEYTNLVADRDFKPIREGRHHLNIYQNIMIGSKSAKTEYVAMAEDDILYSHNHFHSPQIYKDFSVHGDAFLYDMNKVSLFTWTNPPMFSFRSKRMVVNQLIAPAKMLADSMEERFERLDYLMNVKGKPEESVLRIWGDPGRYHKHLGVQERKMVQYYCNNPSIVFTHPKAYGYLNHGKRKRLGDIRIIELHGWGKAKDILKLWGTQATE